VLCDVIMLSISGVYSGDSSFVSIFSMPYIALSVFVSDFPSYPRFATRLPGFFITGYPGKSLMHTLLMTSLLYNNAVSFSLIMTPCGEGTVVSIVSC